jgi:hypothetical protein
MKKLVSGCVLLSTFGCSDGGSRATEKAGESGATPSSSVAGLAASVSISSSAAALKFIRPSGITSLTVRTLPNADCTLVKSGDLPESGLEFGSDELGQVHFYAHPAGAALHSASLALNCTAADGTVSAQQVDVSVDASATDDPLLQPGKPRPPLAGDPMSYSQSELVQRGYPPRPDPSQSPGTYQKWLAKVSRQAMMVGPGVPLRRKHVFNAQYSSHWSGCATTQTLTFEAVEGSWVVPTVTGTRGQSPCAVGNVSESSFWVGVDGWLNTEALIQTGTSQYVYFYPESGSTCSSGGYMFSDYYAWVEYYTAYNGGSGPEVYEFDVSPGDQMDGEAWAGDYQGTFSDAYYAKGWYDIYDSNSDSEYLGSQQPPAPDSNPPAGAYFEGLNAEWILENPKNPDGDCPSCPTYFADYGTATMSSPSSYDTVNGWQESPSWSSITLSPDNGTTIYSTAACGSNAVMTWHRFF